MDGLFLLQPHNDEIGKGQKIIDILEPGMTGLIKMA